MFPVLFFTSYFPAVSVSSGQVKEEEGYDMYFYLHICTVFESSRLNAHAALYYPYLNPQDQMPMPRSIIRAAL